MRAAIVDDDPRDAARLREYLEKYGAENQIDFSLEVYQSSGAFLEALRHDLDILFLDVEMPGMTGMQLAREVRLHDSTVGIIFVTNMAQYALQGYQVNAVDYMVKPVSYYTFAHNLKRAMRFVQRRSERELLLPGEDGLVRVSAADIQYVEKNKNYLVYHTTAGAHAERGTMQDAKAKLAQASFTECSSGCLVNLQWVDRVEKDVVWVGAARLPISRRMKKDFLRAFLDHTGGGC